MAKGTVCKTVLYRFESDRHLQIKKFKKGIFREIGESLFHFVALGFKHLRFNHSSEISETVAKFLDLPIFQKPKHSLDGLPEKFTSKSLLKLPLAARQKEGTAMS